MSLTDNKTTARRFYESYNTRNLEAIFAFVAPQVIWHGPSGQPLSRELWRQIDASLFHAFPDLSLTIDDQIAEEDRVVTRTILQGTHQGEFQSLAPTGKSIVMRAINIDRIAGGQIVEHWVATYSPGLMQQLTAPTL